MKHVSQHTYLFYRYVLFTDINEKCKKNLNEGWKANKRRGQAEWTWNLDRYALRKKLRDYLGIFPIGGGVFPIPKTFVN